MAQASRSAGRVANPREHSLETHPKVEVAFPTRIDYTEHRAKSSAQSAVTVRDTKTGKTVTVRGAGALKDSDLKISKDVDLTKPISSQALKDRRK
jgi:hypothetical protein